MNGRHESWAYSYPRNRGAVRMVISQHIGILERPAFVVVHRDHYSYPGVLFEWSRRRQPGGWAKRSARVIYMDKKVLRQSWFLEAFVDLSPTVLPPQGQTD
jgi:hypothetical protein